MNITRFDFEYITRAKLQNKENNNSGQSIYILWYISINIIRVFILSFDILVH